MPDQAQNYRNHAKYVIGYHVVLAAILLLNLGYAVLHLWRHPGYPQSWVYLALAFGLVLLFYYARAFALTAQDRLIRLEETLRMERLLPPELAARIGELDRAQFVALRFASDAELPSLVRKVLDERIVEQKAIKQLIRDWRADHLRV